MTITVYPISVRADASALIVYHGAPARTVSWSLAGSGTLTPLTEFTDANGNAAAKYLPGTIGATVVITAVAGAP